MRNAQCTAWIHCIVFMGRRNQVDNLTAKRVFLLSSFTSSADTSDFIQMGLSSAINDTESGLLFLV